MLIVMRTAQNGTVENTDIRLRSCSIARSPLESCKLSQHTIGKIQHQLLVLDLLFLCSGSVPGVEPMDFDLLS
jgi:hypothetical protein